MAGDLVKFLRERLDEDEAKRWAVHDVAKCDALLYEELPADAPLPDADACECGYPAHVLAEVAAKRAILALHNVHSEPGRWGDSGPDLALRGQPTGRTSYWCEECDHDRDYGHIGGPEEGCRTLRQLAAVYSSHPGYRDEWKP